MVQKLKEMQECRKASTNPFPLNIQLFADGSQEPPVTSEEEPQGEPVTPPVEPAVESTKQLTQKDIDDAVAAARNTWLAELQEQQTEAQKLAKMTADQKKEYLEQKRIKDIEKREQEITKRELTATAKEALIGKNLPVELADFLDYTNAESCNKSIEAISTAFQKAVETHVNERLKGGPAMKKAPATEELSKRDQLLKDSTDMSLSLAQRIEAKNKLLNLKEED